MRTHLTYANVMATIALFIALGGSSYAAVQLTKNSVRSKHIKNGQVKSADLGKKAVNSAKVADGSLLRGDFAAGQLPAGPPGARGDKGDKGDKGETGGQGAAGSDAQFTGATAGGALSGTYPNPSLATGAVQKTSLAPDALTLAGLGFKKEFSGSPHDSATTHFATARCPLGKAAVGGGASVFSEEDSAEIGILYSFPNIDGGWSVAARELPGVTHTGSWNVVAWAICLRA